MISILSMLFNLMLKTNYVPNAFGIGLTIPIPKNVSNTKVVSSDDFRGITISPLLSKLFENCLLRITNDYLATSDMQFGFKTGLGCNHALYTVRSTIDYFNTNNSNVNLCSIDLCKAFDKVNYYALFLKLIDRNVPRKIISILKCWYAKVFTTVKWKESISYKVKLTAGVRQGGILSPYLFAVFVDNILVKLNDSSLGCHINRLCYNAVMYADDLLLLALSLRDLQEMVDLCIDEFNQLDLQINFKKSMCMRIGKSHKEKIASVQIAGEDLEWKQEMRYLGVIFVSANSFQCNLLNARQKFFKALNGIFAKIGTKASAMIILSLVNSYCVPVLLYGCESILLKSKHRNSLDNAYRAVFAKIFSTCDNGKILNCQFYCGVLPINYSADIRTFQFYNSLMKTANLNVKLHFQRTGFKEYEQLCRKYGLNINYLQNLKAAMWRNFEKTFSEVNLQSI